MRLVAMALAVLVLAGCGADTPTAAGLTVFAAASLTESFTRIGRDFEAASQDVTVTFNFAGSSALAQQIEQGAPADVFASASPATMRHPSTVFARNRLEIAVAAGNPHRITSLAGLATVRFALCAERVPCGAAARKAFQAAGITPTPVTLEQDVKATLTKLKLGEVDAALVYRTDVRSTPEVEGVTFPEADQAVNDYPIAVLSGSPKAESFVDFVRSGRGRQVLAEAGFEVP